MATRRVIAIFLRRLFNCLHQVDDLGRLATLLLLDGFDGLWVKPTPVAIGLLGHQGADMLLNQFVGLLLKCTIDIDVLA